MAAVALSIAAASARPVASRQASPARTVKAATASQDDSLVLHPPKDLALQPEGERKAQALTSYVEALDLQEDGESEKALAAFEKVLNVDPGEVDLATRVAFLLTREGDYPRAIDILKDAVKAQPKATEALSPARLHLREVSEENGAGHSLCEAGGGARA